MAAVQALPPAPAAHTSPTMAPAPPANTTAAPWGAGALHQRLSSFVKKTLLQQLVPTGAVVCDLFCGRGVDTENWAEAQIGKYVGVDLSASALEEAREHWEKNEKPFPATFCELNPCMADLEKHLGEDSLRADVVTCLSHLQDCFVSEDMVRRLLQNVSSLLKPGGYFFGATPDSSTIWYKYQKAVEGAMKAGSLRANGQLPRVRTELYSISFEDDRFQEYGSRYQLRFADESVPPQSQVLVHFPSLIRGAKEVGLEYVEIQNLTEFYEDYRVPFADTLLSSCGTLVDAKGHPVVDGKSRLSPVAQDVLSLYTTFIFRKPAPIQRVNASQVPTSTLLAADVKRDIKPSPALSVKSAVPDPKEEVPWKKQKISAFVAVGNEGGPQFQDTGPKTEIPKKPAEIVLKIEKIRGSARGLKPSERDPKSGHSQASVSGSIPQEKVLKTESSSAGARRSRPPERMQKIESPGMVASKSKVFEQVAKLESPNPRADDSRVEGTHSSRTLLRSLDPYLDKPSSSKGRSDSQQRSDTSGRENIEIERKGSESGHSQDSLKRKQESGGGRSLTPGGAPSSGEESIERRDEGITQLQSDRVSTRKARSVIDHQLERGANQEQSGAPTRTELEANSTLKPAAVGTEPQPPSSSLQMREDIASVTQPAKETLPQREGKVYHKRERSTATEQSKLQRGPVQKRKSLSSFKEHQPERGPIQKRDATATNDNEASVGKLEAGVAQVKRESQALDHEVRKESTQKRERPVVGDLHLDRNTTQSMDSKGTGGGSTHTRETADSEAQPDRGAIYKKRVGTEGRSERAKQNNDKKSTGLIASKRDTTAGAPFPEIVGPYISKILGLGAHRPEKDAPQKGGLATTKGQPERETVEGQEITATDSQLNTPAVSAQKSGTTSSDMDTEELGAIERRICSAAEASIVRLSAQNHESSATTAAQTNENASTEPQPESGLSQKGEDAATKPHTDRVLNEKKEDGLTGLQPESESYQNRESSTARELLSARGPNPRHVSSVEYQLEKRESNMAMEPPAQRGASQQRESLPLQSSPLRGQGPDVRELEAAWPETTPQRYTRRRATAVSQGGEGITGISQTWSNRSNFTSKNERDQPPQGSTIYHSRTHFANPASGFGAGLQPPTIRVGDRRDNSKTNDSNVKPHDVMIKSHDGPGLLGAAPPHIINSQRDRRYEMMGPPDGGQSFGHSQGDPRLTRNRSMRGPLYKDRGPGGSRTPSEFGGEGSHPGLGSPWEEHVQGNGRGRNR